MPSSYTATKLTFVDQNGDSYTVEASDKVSIQQDTSDAGKALGIGQDGRVTPVPFSGDDFTGATAQTAGVHGYVPAPAAGDQMKMLCGDGTWQPGSSARVITVEGTVTNVSGAYSGTFNDDRVTADMKPLTITLGSASVFKADDITVTCNAGSITVTCSSVEGTSTIAVDMFKATTGRQFVTSDEYDALDAAKKEKADFIVKTDTVTISAGAQAGESTVSCTNASDYKWSVTQVEDQGTFYSGIICGIGVYSDSIKLYADRYARNNNSSTIMIKVTAIGIKV